jgi:hypothetical protein
MKNIFKKLDTLAPPDRATAILWRWIIGILVTVVTIIIYPPLLILLIGGGALTGLGWAVRAGYRSLHHDVTHTYRKRDSLKRIEEAAKEREEKSWGASR